MDEIIVLAEHRKGELRDITLEMLSLANRLGAENGLGVTALLLGQGISGLSGPINGACDRILQMDAPELENYSPGPYLRVLEGLLREREPRFLFLGHTAAGMDLAPVLALRTGIPLVTDCLGIQLKDGTPEALRQIYAGKIDEHLTIKPAGRLMLTIRPGSTPGEGAAGKATETETLPAPEWSDLAGRQFLEYRDAELEDVDITAADILVSVGRGIEKPENIPVIQEFADAIGATLSCSRPVADKEWLPKSRQVGTSGKTVKPKIYIALGISGAFQHQAGMKNAGTIIAVNRDPKAPIFSVAHYGIVGDLMQVIPALAEHFTKDEA